MPVWDSFLSERDRRIFGSAGYGKRAGFGQRPVVLVIDVNYNFVGDRPEPIEESVKRWRNSCGEWRAICEGGFDNWISSWIAQARSGSAL